MSCVSLLRRGTTLLNMSKSSDQTQNLLILSPMPYPFCCILSGTINLDFHHSSFLDLLLPLCNPSHGAITTLAYIYLKVKALTTAVQSLKEKLYFVYSWKDCALK